MITIAYDKTRKHCPFFLIVGRGKRMKCVDLVGATADTAVDAATDKGYAPDNWGRIL